MEETLSAINRNGARHSPSLTQVVELVLVFDTFCELCVVDLSILLLSNAD